MARINKADINTADQKTLEGIEGLSHIKAKRIIRYRQKRGYFKSVDELTELKGFDVAHLKDIKSKIEAKPPAKAPKAGKPAIRFYGIPSNLQGTIDLESQSSTQQQRLIVQFEQNQKLVFSGKSPGIIKLRGINYSDTNKSIPISFSVIDSTPPGTYKTNMIVNNTSYETVIEVAEHIEVTMQPNLIFIEAEPGTTVTKSISISNSGNVPITFRDPGAIIIEDDNFECRAIRSTVRSIKNVDEFNEMIKLAAEKLEDLYDEAGGMRVKLKGKPVTIESMQTVKVLLEFVLPSKLRSGNFYTGFIRYYDDSVKLQVLPTSKVVT